MRKLRLEELERDSIEAFRSKAKSPIHVVLDNVRSGHNVGSILRTADAFNVAKVWMTGITAVPPHKEILKTAIGASESVEWEYHQDPLTLLHDLKAVRISVIGVEQTDGSIPLSEIKLELSSPVALVFGNEVQGLSSHILPILDMAIEIPQYGTKHSLNVSVCAGIVMHAFHQMFVAKVP